MPPFRGERLRASAADFKVISAFSDPTFGVHSRCDEFASPLLGPALGSHRNRRFDCIDGDVLSAVVCPEHEVLGVACFTRAPGFSLSGVRSSGVHDGVFLVQLLRTCMPLLFLQFGHGTRT